jgi:hypothetical protein
VPTSVTDIADANMTQLLIDAGFLMATAGIPNINCLSLYMHKCNIIEHNVLYEILE